MPGGDGDAQVHAVRRRWERAGLAAQQGFRPRLVAGSMGMWSHEQAVLLRFALSCTESPIEKTHTPHCCKELPGDRLGPSGRH